jgi:hypothetical protein
MRITIGSFLMRTAGWPEYVLAIGALRSDGGADVLS